MTRRGSWSVLLGCLLLLGCAPDTPPGPRPGSAIDLVDDAGRRVVLVAPPGRILSLVPSATDILLALGQRDRLVGRTDFDVDVRLIDLPSVGGGLAPSMERIVSLMPDIVIRFRAESDPTTPRQLDARGIPHVAIRPDRIEDVRRIIGLLGMVVGESERADSLRGSMDAELEEVASRVRDVSRPRVAFVGGDPPSVAGPGTFLHELVELAGGENAFSDLGELYAPISLEELLRRDVDRILAPESTPLPGALGSTPVSRVPVTVITPGLQVGQSARQLATLLHPDRFP